MTIPARYSAPEAEAIFSDLNRLDLWKQITDEYAWWAADSSNLSQGILGSVMDTLRSTTAPSPEMVAEFEAETGHEVVAFLAAYCVKLGASASRYVHDGLTSSDLVEYGLFQQVSQHALYMAERVRLLRNSLLQVTDWPSLRPGRTHGQTAEVTSYHHQMHVQQETFARLYADLSDIGEASRLVKYPGPTGWPGALPEVFERGRSVADSLNCEFEPATQVIHRDRLLAWAAAYLRLSCALENLALQVRLSARSEIAEVREGAQRVGSSAMPHKHNPIGSERVCGLARIVRGDFLALAEGVALWEDRDLTNSSLERIAVPSLASTVEFMTDAMYAVMDNLEVDWQKMHSNAKSPACHTNLYQVVAQRMFNMSPVDASKLVRDAINTPPYMVEGYQAAVYSALRNRGWDASAWDAEVDRRKVSRNG